MTARPCCIYSAAGAGNQGPIPGLADAQIFKQVQLCWLALSPPSACILFCMWVCCLPMWKNHNEPLDPSRKPKKAAASWPLCCLSWTLLGEFREHCHPHLYFLAGMVALVAGEGVSAHPHHYISEVCELMTRQAQLQALTAVKGTAALRPAYPDVLKAQLKCV